MKRSFCFLILILFCALAVSAQDVADPCSSLGISLSAGGSELGKVSAFAVESKANLETRDVSYRWTVQGGKIVDGQNTKSVKVLRENAELTVTVEVQVPPENCTFRSTETSIICFESSILVDEFGEVSAAEERARLVRFFEDLLKNPNDQGFIVWRDDKKVKRRLSFLNQYIKQKSFDSSRISLMIGDKNEDRTQYFRAPPGTAMPDCKDCVVIAVEDLEKDESNFDSKIKRP